MHKRELMIAASLIAFGVLGRWLPHLPDATPFTAVAFAAALYVSRRWAILVPLVSVFIADLWLGFYDIGTMTVVYLSWIFVACIGLVLRKHPGILQTGVATLGASFLFFLTTNFAVWAFSPWYPHTITGLIYCYELGLPFWRNMLMGDAIYVPLLLGSLALVYRPARKVRALVAHAR